MKPDSITIPVTLTFDPAGQELAELARHIVTRLTDEGALDEAAEHGHGIMATSAAIEWARERLGNHNPPHPIVLSSVIGEGTLRPLKVVEADADGHGAVVEMRPDGSLWFWPEGAFGEDAATDISSALYGAGETLEQLARTGELDRVAGLEHVIELPSGDTVRFAATDAAADLLAVATAGRRMIRTPPALARPDGLVVDAGQGFE